MFVILKRKSKKYWEKVKLSKTIEREYEKSFTKSIKYVRNKVEVKEILRRLKEEIPDIDKTVEALPWDAMKQEFDSLSNLYYDGSLRSAKMAVDFLPKVYKRELFFDPNSGRLKKLIDGRFDRLFSDFSADSKSSIKKAISRRITHGVPPERIAETIEKYIGLDDRFSSALSRYEEKLSTQDVPESKKSKLLGYYEEKLLKIRNKTIARTESAFIVNAGDRELMYQAVEGEIIPQNKIVKIWRIDAETACQYCMPLDGRKTPLDGIFSSLGLSTDIPPLHPNCNCLIEYEIEV